MISAGLRYSISIEDLRMSGSMSEADCSSDQRNVARRLVPDSTSGVPLYDWERLCKEGNSEV